MKGFDGRSQWEQEEIEFRAFYPKLSACAGFGTAFWHFLSIDIMYRIRE